MMMMLLLMVHGQENIQKEKKFQIQTALIMEGFLQIQQLAVLSMARDSILLIVKIIKKFS